MLLPAAANTLSIQGTPEELPLRTVWQDIQVLQGSSVSFRVSSPARPQTSYKIKDAFTGDRLSPEDRNNELNYLQKKYRHLCGLPILPLKDAKPLLLIGSDPSHLVKPIEPVRFGPPGGPAAVHTRLGWTLQGPVWFMGRPVSSHVCIAAACCRSQPARR